jgi:apolipoprotein N-acyltransferase
MNRCKLTAFRVCSIGGVYGFAAGITTLLADVYWLFNDMIQNGPHSYLFIVLIGLLGSLGILVHGMFLTIRSLSMEKKEQEALEIRLKRLEANYKFNTNKYD